MSSESEDLSDYDNGTTNSAGINGHVNGHGNSNGTAMSEDEEMPLVKFAFYSKSGTLSLIT